ncbi:MAG TPA: hypothetical protein VGD08_11245 [Stellaceae bacterium]
MLTRLRRFCHVRARKGTGAVRSRGYGLAAGRRRQDGGRLAVAVVAWPARMRAELFDRATIRTALVV